MYGVAALGLLLMGSLAKASPAPAVPAKMPLTAPTPAWDTYSDTWAGVDGLGRALPTFAQVGPPRRNKQVGIFYYLWLTANHDNGPYDVTRILTQDPDALKHPNSPLWGGVPGFHYWGEPLFGYYSTGDPAIIRKHAQMLTDAGVNMLLFDASNGALYEDDLNHLIDTYHQMRAEGQTTPLLAFHVVAGDARLVPEVKTLYNEYYKNPKNADLWYHWQGKPVIVGTPVPELGPEILNFFTFRKSYWNGLHPGPGSWNTDGYYPTENPAEIMRDANGKVEQMGVATASSIVHSPISNQGPGNSRAWHLGVKTGHLDTSPGAVGRGIQFQDEFDFARKLDPDFILVYDWNEWIAQRFENKEAGTTFFVDEFNVPFSKDIEPMTTAEPGSIGDNYYYQLVGNVRRYAGVRHLPAVRPYPIKLGGTFAGWARVQPEFRDNLNDPVHRDYPGWSKTLHYVNQTGRNDTMAAKVSYDAKNIYFYVRTQAKMTPHTGKDWMVLYLNTDGSYNTGWLGYDYAVNRHAGNSTTTLEKNKGGKYKWQTIGQVKYQAAGNELVIAVPRTSLGVTTLPATIDFKWADHCYAKGDWTDFTLNGDAAPNDRFNFRAKLAAGH